MATIVTASPMNFDQLTKRRNAQKDKSPSKEKNGEVKIAAVVPKGHTGNI
ncbi:13555_t:CDS:2 [Rhizophagus irregularis]|nr:13555_t:CDS:2 [Rhizophagus irregularis]